jgi:hypothetical protein
VDAWCIPREGVLWIFWVISIPAGGCVRWYAVGLIRETVPSISSSVRVSPDDSVSLAAAGGTLIWSLGMTGTTTTADLTLGNGGCDGGGGGGDIAAVTTSTCERILGVADVDVCWSIGSLPLIFFLLPICVACIGGASFLPLPRPRPRYCASEYGGEVSVRLALSGDLDSILLGDLL